MKRNIYGNCKNPILIFRRPFHFIVTLMKLGIRPYILKNYEIVTGLKSSMKHFKFTQ